MRRMSVLVLVASVAIATGADAKPRHARAKPAPSSLFLGSTPHVPLATILDGRVHDAVDPRARGKSCGDPRRWARLGSKWNALDAWGQITGTHAVTASDLYDVTACSELAFASDPSRDAHLFVSADSAWRASPSLEWKPSAPEIQAFRALVRRTIPDGNVSSNEVPSECKAVSAAPRFFESRTGARFAVGTSNTGHVIAKLEATWKVIDKVLHAPRTPFGAVCARVVSVFDMNGDGKPEVILLRSGGDAWDEAVLSVGDDGEVREVADSPGGATA